MGKRKSNETNFNNNDTSETKKPKKSEKEEDTKYLNKEVKDNNETEQNNSQSEKIKIIIKSKNLPKPESKIIKTNKTNKINSKDIVSDLDKFIRFIEINRRNDSFFRSRYEKTTLIKLLPTLWKLNRMIGMEKFKKDVINTILFYVQCLDIGSELMMHTVIEGSPGTGKTEAAKILGEIYKKLGFLSNDKFIIAKRDDFIAGYLGQTAIKTRKLLEKCEGGVLFIDEAYSLGNKEGKDSFSKEALDLLNEHLSANKKNFICIIAGYSEHLKTCFFDMNPGLERRFPWKFSLSSYESDELCKIFIKQTRNDGWSIDEETITASLFEKNKNYFKNNGGDTENLFQKCKIAHSHRLFLDRMDNKFMKKRLLNKDDIENGLEFHKRNYLDKVDDMDMSWQKLYS